MTSSQCKGPECGHISDVGRHSQTSLIELGSLVSIDEQISLVKRNTHPFVEQNIILQWAWVKVDVRL